MSECRGLMEPIGIRQSKKGLQILHRCTACGTERPNMAAMNTVQDDFEAVLALMRVS